jgi:hypothetical protein
MTRRRAVSPARIARRDALFDFLAANPDGATLNEISAALQCRVAHSRGAVSDLRLFLGDTDSVNVPCVPAGPGEQYTYRLVGTFDETREWIANRINDTESRMDTMRSVMASVVAATTATPDIDPIDARRASLIERGLRHLIEDLEALHREAGPPTLAV